MTTRPEVHLRIVTADDAEWIVALDEAATTRFAGDHGWEVEKFAAELDEGLWASDERFAWAIVVDGDPVGFALATDLATNDGVIDIRIAPERRGRGVGREVLRLLVDHHFAAHPGLNRMTGRAHEHNVPMQRAFNAAGFRMEARYRDSFLQADDSYAAEWGYALTRADWDAGRHRSDHLGYDLHGLTFVLDETSAGPVTHGLLVKFLQEGRRAIARYDAHQLADGELAGVLVGDVITYRFVHVQEGRDGDREVTGGGRARLQRRGDGRLEAVDEWYDDVAGSGTRLLVERHDDHR